MMSITKALQQAADVVGMELDDFTLQGFTDMSMNDLRETYLYHVREAETADNETHRAHAEADVKLYAALIAHRG